MGMYIGDVYLPAVGEFTVDRRAKKTEVLKHLGDIPDHVAEFNSDVLPLKIGGTLYQVASTVKTATQYADDLMGLVERRAPYNYIYDFQGRTGWAVLEEETPPDLATSPLVRKFDLTGMFLPRSKYRQQFHTNPTILTNDFSLTFGSDGCDNYVALPIGSTYSGGDTTTISRIGADGTATLMLATTENDVQWDLADDEVDVGECKCWDTVTGGNTTESTWVRVFNKDHEFDGDIVIENGLVRVKVLIGTGLASIYSYYSSAWTMITGLKVDTTTTDCDFLKFYSLGPDEISIQVQYTAASTTPTEKIIVRRGEYLAERETIEASVVKYENILQSQRFAYTNETLYDALMDTGNLALTTSRNHFIVFNPTLAFFIVMATTDLDGYYAYDAGTTISALINTGAAVGAKSMFGGVPFDCTKLFKECEDMTQGSGVAFYTGADASPKTGNTGSILNAQNEYVQYSFEGGTDLPLGDYKLVVRAKDSAQVADDLGVTVYNTDNSTDVMTPATQLLTASWAFYYFDVTLASDDDGDAIRVKLNKETATANTIDLDYIAWIPISLDNLNGPLDISHQAMVNKQLKRELIAR